MAMNRYLNEPQVISFDQRCVRCRQGQDRIGRYCRRCLKSQRLKLFFGSIAAVQLAIAGFIVLQSTTQAKAIPIGFAHSIVPAKNQLAGWLYYDVTDPLIEDVTHHARLIGNSPVAPAGSPATAGAQRGTLEVSYSRHYGSIIMLSFPVVPKACGANPCEVHVIFDHLPAAPVPFQDVSDKSSTVLLLGEQATFLASLPRAHDLTVVANMGAGQDSVMTFRVEGYAMSLAARGVPVRLAAAQQGKVGGAVPAPPNPPSSI